MNNAKNKYLTKAILTWGWLIALVFALSPFLSRAQVYNFKLYELESELDIPSVSTMYSSNKGYLYFGGKETLYKFDGKRSDKIFPELALPFAEIRNIHETEGEIYFINNDRLNSVNRSGEFSELPIGETIKTYLIDEQKTIYGTDNGIKIYDTNANIIDVPEALEKLKSFSINDLERDDRMIYIASEAGLWIYNTKSRTLSDFNESSSYNLQELILDASGIIWAYDDEGSILAIDFQRRKMSSFQNPGYRFTDIDCDEQGRIWFSSLNKGLLVYEISKSKWKIIDSQRGLVDNRVKELIVDSWGSIWIITADNILSKFIDKDYELFNVYNGLESDKINAIFTNTERLIISNGNKGVFEYKNGSFELIPNSEPLKGTKSTAIFADSSNVWVGTNGKGLVKINNLEYTIFRKESGLPSDWINCLAMDSIGSLWIGTPANGIARLSQRDSSAILIDRLGLEEGLKDLHITALMVASNGLVYYGTQSGSLGCFVENRHFNIPGSEALGSSIKDLRADAKGNIYVATQGNGLYLLRQGKKSFLQPFSEEEIKLPRSASAISIFREQLWIANEKGIQKVDLLNKENQSASFSLNEGFPSRNVTPGQMKAYKDHIWIGTADGLIKIGDIISSENRHLPKIHFVDVLDDFKPIRSSRKTIDSITKINFSDNRINFKYEGVDVNSNKDLSYSYILEGEDKDWSPWTKSDNQSFNGLRAGSYTFKVRAKSSETAISEAISFPFIINGPFWKEWWFIPSCIFAALLFFYIGFRTRLRNIRKRNEEEKAQLELKNKLLELEQKANQLQMNPHFIFNALNSIQSTVAKEDYRDARKEINDFATLMRSILSNSKERVISLQDEINLLRKYIEIERTCRSLDFEFTFEVAAGIDPVEIMIPPMLIQPFVENAIIHGLKKKENGELQIKLNLLQEEVLKCEVIDNGIGYETSKSLKLRPGHKSVALDVTKERLENLVNKDHHPVVNIQQVDKEKGGTIASLKIPIEYNF